MPGYVNMTNDTPCGKNREDLEAEKEKLEIKKEALCEVENYIDGKIHEINLQLEKQRGEEIPFLIKPN